MLWGGGLGFGLRLGRGDSCKFHVFNLVVNWRVLTVCRLNGLFGVVAQARPDQEWAEFASECCTTWGSFGYLCSALCQWYESVNKHPVEEVSSHGKLRRW